MGSTSGLGEASRVEGGGGRQGEAARGSAAARRNCSTLAGQGGVGLSAAPSWWISRATDGCSDGRRGENKPGDLLSATAGTFATSRISTRSLQSPPCPRQQTKPLKVSRHGTGQPEDHSCYRAFKRQSCRRGTESDGGPEQTHHQTYRECEDEHTPAEDNKGISSWCASFSNTPEDQNS